LRVNHRVSGHLQNTSDSTQRLNFIDRQLSH
jgi:hypothetical protein